MGKKNISLFSLKKSSHGNDFFWQRSPFLSYKSAHVQNFAYSFHTGTPRLGQKKKKQQVYKSVFIITSYRTKEIYDIDFSQAMYYKARRR